MLIIEWIKWLYEKIIYEWFFERGAETTWTYPTYPGKFGGAWGYLHIFVLIFCALTIVGLFFIYKYSKNKEKTKKIILISLSSLIALFEILIRFLYLMKRYYFVHPGYSYMNVFWIMMPKPWCAISCWLAIACPIVNKKFFYNLTSISGLICTCIYFLHPGVGYNYVIFNDFYSLATHAILFTTSISLITLKFTEFKYKTIWKVAIGFALIYAYSFIEIFVFKFPEHGDPLYFMPNGDIQGIIKGIIPSFGYAHYLILYIFFVLTFINAFYLFSLIKKKKTNK